MQIIYCNIAFNEMMIYFQVVNTEKIKDGSKRDLAFGLEIGDKKLWTALHTFTIDGIEEVGNDDPTVDNR